MRSSVLASRRSVTRRRASAFAASTYTGSLSSVRACSSVFERERLMVQAVRAEASKVVKLGYGTVRFKTV